MPKIVVRGLSRAHAEGKLHLENLCFPCALGRGGRRPKGGEGDGITPKGRWIFRKVFYRPDRVQRPRTGLPVLPLTQKMGWCDAPGDANYNRLVRLPYPTGHESLWRQDHLYDLLAVLGYNDAPRSQGRGSAIFLHLARNDYGPTEGCVALSVDHMRVLLKALRPGQSLIVA